MQTPPFSMECGSSLLLVKVRPPVLMIVVRSLSAYCSAYLFIPSFRFAFFFHAKAPPSSSLAFLPTPSE